MKIYHYSNQENVIWVFLQQKRKLNWSHLLIKSIFTLIELLLIVAIIAILFTMLLPALRKAKEMGDRSVCTNNEKQLYLAMGFYREDNDQYEPAQYGHSLSTSWPYNTWYSTMTQGGYLPMIPRLKTWDDWYSNPDGLQYEGVLECPSEKTTSGPDYAPTIYLANVPGLDPIDHWYGRPFKLMPVREFTNIAYLMDIVSYERYKLARPPDLNRSFRHGNGLNICFCDGHVDWRSMKSLWYQNSECIGVTIAYKQRFWAHGEYYKLGEWMVDDQPYSY